MVNIHESQKDWFEFILDLDLLDNYFSTKSDKNESFGNSLIIQFLYHANMTEQVYANPINKTEPAVATINSNISGDHQGEFKCKRIKILRILAIKTACLLDWNLLKFEKDIPVAVMSDLLHIFLKYTMKPDEEQTLHSHLEIDKLENHSIFALQLLHRWCLRIIVSSRLLKRPPNKSTVINVPGIVNPLQHMKDANENILKVLLNNIQESVDFLEKCLETLTHDICLPTSDCFTNLSADTGGYDIVWEKAKNYDVNLIKTLVSYDLGVYFFQQEKYGQSLKYLQRADELKICIKSGEVDSKYLSMYLYELKSYLLACSSMVDDEKPSIGTGTELEHNFKRLVDFETNPDQEGYQTILEILERDMPNNKFSISLRQRIEEILAKSDQQTVYNRISTLNLASLIVNSGYSTALSNIKNHLTELVQIFEKNYNIFTLEQKNNVTAFLQLHYDKTDQSTDLHIKFNLKPTSMSNIIPNITCFSYKSIANSVEIVKTDLMNKKHLLQTSKSQTILSYIDSTESTIQAESYRNKLYYFWTRWETHIHPLMFIKNRNTLTNDVLERFFATTNQKELQFYYISFAKIYELVRVRKFDAAFFLLKGLEQKGIKNGRFLSDIALFVNVSKCLYELDFSESRKDQKYKLNLEKKIQNAKDFFIYYKNVSDIPPLVCKTVLAFLVSVQDYEFLKGLSSLEATSVQNNNNNNNSHHNNNSHQNKKQRLENKNGNATLVEICRNLAKLSLDIEKNDRMTARKVAREVWDNVIEVFTDTNSSKASSSNKVPLNLSIYQANLSKESQTVMNRETLRTFLIEIKNPMVSSLVISLLSTIYNIGESMVNIEVFSEYRFLWPSSIASSSSLNINSVLDLMNALLANYILEIKPDDSYMLRTNGDICLASTSFFDASKFYLQVFVCETRFFSKIFEKSTEAYFEDHFEKTLKSMVRCCIQMNKHTHAALLSQMSQDSVNQDYNIIFRSFQDRTVLTMDEMDMAYSCLWDMSLLEFFTFIHASRGQIDKRNKCLKLCASKALNAANSCEITERTNEAKRKQLFLNLIQYYINV